MTEDPKAKEKEEEEVEVVEEGDKDQPVKSSCCDATVAVMR